MLLISVKLILVILKETKIVEIEMNPFYKRILIFLEDTCMQYFKANNSELVNGSTFCRKRHDTVLNRYKLPNYCLQFHV